MCMYSNQPVSMRSAATVRLASSAVRSLTQLHSLPCSSGCMVSRNRTVSPVRSMISALAYSVNRSGQFSTSLVCCHTCGSGAAMKIEFSVCAAMSAPRLRVDQVDDLDDAHPQRLLGDLHPVPVGDLGLELQDGQGVDAEVLQRHVPAAVERGRLGPGVGDQDRLDVLGRGRSGLS